ncbi:hypothetical protein D3C87_241490 [compost metagenome]
MNKHSFSVKGLYIGLAFCALVPQAVMAQVAAGKVQAPKIEISKNTPVKIQDLQNHLILNNKELSKDYKAQRPEGPRTGGGGNACSLAIAQNTKALSSALGEFEILKGAQGDRLWESMTKAQFYIASSLKLDGQMKDAINIPSENAILVTEHFCRSEVIEVSGRAMGLLLHEYLGLAKIDDSKYQISGAFLQKYAEAKNGNLALVKFVEEQAELDLKGSASCFNGDLKAQHEKYRDTYGGRFSGYSIDGVLRAGGITYRNPGKYCSEAKYDRKGRETDSSKATHKACGTEDEEAYIVPVIMGASTSGTVDDIGVIYQLTKKINTTLLVDKDADWFPRKSEIAKKTVKVSYECVRLDPVSAPAK